MKLVHEHLHQTLVVIIGLITFANTKATETDAPISKYDMVIHTDDIHRIATNKIIPVTTQTKAGTAFPPCEDVTDDFRCHLQNGFTNFNARVFGILGMFNKGKTWFINRMFGKNFGSGSEHTTRGISLSYVKNSGATKDLGSDWLIVDTAGTHATISFQERNLEGRSRAEFETRRIAKQVTMEDFVFELVTKLSDLMVFLVNDLTWLEQHAQLDLYERLNPDVQETTNRQIKQDKKKKLVIVHNYKHADTAEDAQALFVQQVKGQDYSTDDADADPTKPRLFYRDYLGVEHIALMDERGHNGKAVNAQSFERMVKVMERSVETVKKIGFEDLIPLGRSLSKIMHCKDMNSKGVFDTTLQPKPKPEEEAPPDLKIEDEIEADYRIKINVEGDCTMSKVVVRGMDGQNQQASTHQEKLFKTVFKTDYGYGQWESLLVYQFDVPGVRPEDLTFSYNPTTKVEIERKQHDRLAKLEDAARRKASEAREITPSAQFEQSKTTEEPKAKLEEVPSYENKNFLKGKYWAGIESSTLLDKHGKWEAELDAFDFQQNYEFNHRWKPSKRCTDDPDRYSWLRTKCAPYQIIDGILYIVGRKKPEYKIDLDGKQRRRRAQNEF